MNRRTFFLGGALVALIGIFASLPGLVTAQGKVVKIGLSLPLTGSDADGADAILKGAQMAIAEVNGKICEIREYQDSTLCERVLGPYPKTQRLAG